MGHKITKTNSHNSSLFLAELMEMPKFDKMIVGFCEVMKVDENTFTLSAINDDDYVNTIKHEGLVDEIVIKEIQS